MKDSDPTRRRFRYPLDFGEAPEPVEPRPERPAIGWVKQAEIEAEQRRHERVQAWQLAGAMRGWYRL